MAILRLKQADGTWGSVPALKGDPGSGVVLVNFTYGDDGETLTADKSFAELYPAFVAGAMLFANVEDFIYPLIEGWAGGFTFGSLVRLGPGFRYYTVDLNNDDTINTHTAQIPIRDIIFGSGFSNNRLMYFDATGYPRSLKLGAGLKIENGVLMLDGTVTPDTPSKAAICGTVLAGQVLCGEGV